MQVTPYQMLGTYVHGHTTDTWPAVPLGLVLVVSATSLQDGLVNTSTTSDDTCKGAQPLNTGSMLLPNE